MCFNKSVSLTTWVFSLVFSLFLIWRGHPNDKYFGIIFLSFGFIQFLEFLSWLSIEKKNKNLNNTSAKLLFINLWFQALLTTSVIIFSQLWVPFWVPMIIGTLFLFIFLRAVIYILDENDWEVKKGQNCHLVWSFLEDKKIPSLIKLGPSYIYAILIPYLWLKNWKIGLSVFALALASFIFSAVQYSKTKELSSIWCWIANFILVFIVIFN